MVLLPLVLGGCLALAVVIAAWNYRRYPARRRCPLCAGDTAPLAMSGALRSLHPWMQARWCVECGWEGLGRRGPAFDPMRGPASHESGFRWNRDAPATGVAGFEWGSAPRPEETPSPAHPSGFAWAPTEVDSDGDAPPSAAHPSGFRWAPTESADADDEDGSGDHPSGFRWGRSGPGVDAPSHGFVWKDGRDTFV